VTNKLIQYGDKDGTVSVATDLNDFVQIDTLMAPAYVALDHKQVVKLIHQLTDWLGWIAEN